ncbi:MAG: hypothetical protein MZV63_42755 [Marinilabiliales bacterium]|nr:hypothetical protein [Marinilabiliales bacterium]
MPLRAGKARIINHNLKTKDVTVTVTAPDGTPVTGKYDIVSDMRIDYIPDTDVTNASIDIKGRVEKKPGMASVAGRYLIRALMAAAQRLRRHIHLSRDTLLPGYLPGTSFLGQQSYEGMSAPGWRFLTGLTDERFL